MSRLIAKGLGMTSEWREYKLSEITSKITKGTTPSSKDGGFSTTGINYIKAESVGYNGRIDSSKFSFISLDIHKKFKRSQLEKNDILFSMAGVHLGKSALVKKEYLPANTNQALALIRHIASIVNPYYLLFFLQQKSIINFVNNSTSQSAQPNINLQEIGNLDIYLPPLETQKKIAHILSTLDDKIELNRKMNQTLEEMAQALFKSWFVDFDPVHAKAGCSSDEELELAAKELGISKEVLELFPSEFEESGLGMIPKGWEVLTIGNIAKVIDCLHSKKPNDLGVDTGNVLLQLKNIQDDGLLKTVDNYFISNEDYEKWISRIEVTKNDFIITNVGRVGAVARIPSDFKAAIGRNITAIRVLEEFNYISFLHTLLTSAYMKSEINNKTDIGTILDALNVKNIPQLRFVIAPNNVMNYFEELIVPIQDQRENNQLEMQTLQKTRDTLLPKLLSGELDVSEIELDME